ncbi:MAG: Gluconolactonase [Frankiales bacterium]|nr:Gluconolactonase [Frankiales bacterium]
MIQGTLRRRSTALSTAAAVVSAVVMLPGSIPLAHSQVQVASPQKVIATGLDNPRGLAFDEQGTLYVGEAGHAGPLCIGQGPEGPECLGQTSQIGAIDVGSGSHRTVVGGLVSLGTAVAATGVDGVSVFQQQVYGIITGSPGGLPPHPCAKTRARDCASQVTQALSQVGTLIVASDGDYHSVAGVGAFNYLFIVNNKATLDPRNPDFTPGDSNPYGIFQTAGGTYVADGGSNTLSFVDSRGFTRVLSTDNRKPVYIPNPPGPPAKRFPYDSVPTCVTRHGDNVYIGTLSGELWRYNGHTLRQVANRKKGLTAISACADDGNGNVIVSNIFGATPKTTFAPNTGSVMKVSPTGTVTTLARGLNFPGGVAVDANGQVYISVNSVCPKSLSLIGPKDPPFCKATGAILRLATP